MAQYAVLIYAEDSAHAPDATPEDLADCDDHAEELRAADSMLAAYALTPREYASSVRASGRTDGPFLGDREVVAGFSVIEAADLDEAVRIAATNPVVRSGGGVEVRPVHSGGPIRALREEVHGVTDLLPSPCRLCGSRLGVRYPSGWMCAVCEWPHGEHPDGELPPPRVDIVYYLRFDDRVKIGTTANPRQRFGAIRHQEVVAFERGDRRLEQRRHEQFADERAGSSEWFELSDRLRAHIDVLAGGVDPWDRWRRWVAEATATR